MISNQKVRKDKNENIHDWTGLKRNISGRQFDYIDQNIKQEYLLIEL